MTGVARRPAQDRRWTARRVFDIAGASVLLMLSLPILIAGVALVWTGGGRPIFFGHRRLGLGGRVFRCWKLRSMSVDAEEALDRDPPLRQSHRSRGFKLPSRSDPRVPRWGRILRHRYVDEIPQLFNVLVGEMSLVGPRPIVPEELELFGPEAHTLLSVKPGVFGAWTSRGRDRPPYPMRSALELEYVRTRSWRRDLAILVRSIRAVFQGQGEA